MGVSAEAAVSERDRESEKALQAAREVVAASCEKLSQKLTVELHVGSGAFSNVFRASYTNDDNSQTKVAIKHVLPFTHPDRIRRELKYLDKYGGRGCILPCLFTFRHFGHVMIVMPYFEFIEFSEFIKDPDIEDVRLYMKGLFEALSVLHADKVIHRDVKPTNFLIHKSRRRFALIDFGLTETEIPYTRPTHFDRLLRRTSSGRVSKLASGLPAARSSSVGLSRNLRPSQRTLRLGGQSACRPGAGDSQSEDDRRCDCLLERKICNTCANERQPCKNVRRAGTAGFRPPEVLLKSNVQTCGIDMWCAGLILISIVSGKYPFFSGGGGDLQCLHELVTIFGVKMISDVANKLGKSYITNVAANRIRLKSLCLALRYGGERVQFVDNKENENQCYYSKSAPRPNEAAAARLRSEDCDENSRSSFGESSTGLESTGSVAQNGVFPDSLFHLLLNLLEPDPYARISADDALKHPFILNVKCTPAFMKQFQLRKRKKAAALESQKPC